ncbi:hypothetical protein CGGC5_v008906 [Colletotrichum fructicola Nara gc5]|uniref:Uncharacterized protein n=1 Tax=Colletotrichum fructicola (strain Nara gc5) TaxID=1213859 RepID=A0A7J6J0G8_COLFN|nr:hypothetical protein CGGC5_v008906 [Colletotrichum fructicola Nara gc5]
MFMEDTPPAKVWAAVLHLNGLAGKEYLYFVKLPYLPAAPIPNHTQQHHIVTVNPHEIDELRRNLHVDTVFVQLNQSGGNAGSSHHTSSKLRAPAYPPCRAGKARRSKTLGWQLTVYRTPRMSAYWLQLRLQIQTGP